MAYGGLSGLFNSLFNSPRRGFGPLSAPPGSHVPRSLTNAPPEPQEAEGAGVRPMGSVFFQAAAQLVGCLYFRPLGSFHLNPRVRIAVLTPAPSLQPGQDDYRQLSSESGVVRSPGQGRLRASGSSAAPQRFLLVAKKDGGFRPILDLRGLNQFLKVLPFHMLTTSDIRRVVARGEWFTTVDLKDAYFHVPIVSHHQCFLRFAFRGRHFQFRVLPFGLFLSPRVFTRVVAAALAPLQKQGMKVLTYLDDWLLCAPSQSQVAGDTARLLQHAARLGLTVNLLKSLLDPSQQVTYLGMVLDSDAMRASLSLWRVNDILLHLPLFECGRMVPFIQFLRLLGKLTAASTVVPLGLLSLRPLQMWLNSLHLDPKWHRHRKVRVSQRCLLSLSPWGKRPYLSAGVPMGAIPSRR